MVHWQTRRTACQQRPAERGAPRVWRTGRRTRHPCEYVGAISRQGMSMLRGSSYARRPPGDPIVFSGRSPADGMPSFSCAPPLVAPLLLITQPTSPPTAARGVFASRQLQCPRTALRRVYRCAVKQPRISEHTLWKRAWDGATARLSACFHVFCSTGYQAPDL